MGKTAIIHARVSDRKQVANNVSIPSQIEAAEKRASELNAVVVKKYVEEGRSAWHGRRSTFEEAIDFCELNNIDYFITWDTARFTRDTTRGPLFRHRLRSAGTFIEYIAVAIDPETDEGFVLEQVYSMTDELKSRKTSADTTRSMTTNARAGYFNGGRPPFGYTPAPSDTDSKRRQLYVNEDEAAVVREIFSLSQQGLGAGAIAEALQRKGTTNRGKKWTKSTVANLLRNRNVIGEKVFGKRCPITRRKQPMDKWIIVQSHDAIISREVFEMVQTQLDNRTNPQQSGSPRSKWLFTGLMKCGLCGGSMQIETGGRKGKRRSYYNCRNNRINKTCERRAIRADELDGWLINEISENLYTPRFIAQIIAALNKGAEEFPRKHSERLAKVSTNLSNAIDKREKIYDDMEERRYSPEILRPRIEKAHKRVVDLQDELDRLKLQSQPTRMLTDEDASDIRAFMVDMITNPSNPERVRQYLQTFISSIVVEGNDLIINYDRGAILCADGKNVRSRAGWLPGTGSNRRPSD